jgi:hypothetical protein
LGKLSEFRKEQRASLTSFPPLCQWFWFLQVVSQDSQSVLLIDLIFDSTHHHPVFPASLLAHDADSLRVNVLFAINAKL